ncbi:hypothetical protein [Paraglaciecola psychrophila]|uniref:hypothetical protein n=1 Tax=Paraglaciecola psychrophila TaxID=326544 RepID=UPI00129A3425|nr:hypothetical protein [Paraglaciecola psychrophila]
MSDLNTRMPSGSDVTQPTNKQAVFSTHLLELILQSSNSSGGMETSSRQQRGRWH